MTWMSLKNGFSQALDSANYYVGACARVTGARMTQVAQAVYENSESVRHFHQGFSQIFRAYPFLKIGKTTRDLYKRSAETNIVKYLAPGILFSRLTPALRKTALYNAFPDTVEYGVLAYYVVLVLLMARLLQRRKEENGIYITAFPRVIKNDIDIILPHTFANRLAEELTARFNKLFITSSSVTLIHQDLFVGFKRLFENFFQYPVYNAESYNILKEPLTTLFQQTIRKHYFIHAEEFSEKLAEELIRLLAKDFDDPDVLQKKAEKDGLLFGLEYHFSQSESASYAVDIRNRLLRVKIEIQSFLPVVYYPPCCIDNPEYSSVEYLRRVNLANISSTPYYLLKLASTSLPDILYVGSLIPPKIFMGMLLITLLLPNLFYLFDYLSQKTSFALQFTGLLALSVLYAGHFVPPEVLLGLQMISMLSRILLAGQVNLEAIVAKEMHCTRHRTEEINRHKIYAFGMGVSQMLISEFFAQLVLLGTGVRNACTTDAIDQLVIQASMISLFANNARLPGRGKNTWNLFFLPQRAARVILDAVNNRLAEKPKSPEVLLARLKKVADVLSVYAWFVWGPGAIFPTLPTEEYKADLQAYLLQDERLRYLLLLFRGNILNALDYVGKSQQVNSWVARPLSWISRPASWVMPRIVFTSLVIASKLLSDEALSKLVETIKLELKKIEIEDVINKEPEPEFELESEPALLKLEEEKPVEDKPVEDKLAEALLTNLLSTQPLPHALEKQPVDVDITAFISAKPYFKKPEKEIKKEIKKVDDFEWIDLGSSQSKSALERYSFVGNLQNAVAPKTTSASLQPVSRLTPVTR